MRVISGTAGRLQLEAPKSMARPSTDRLREALFSILGNRMENAQVLDLFAGSGALGIEALSRGAKHATFVDLDRAAITALNTNLKRTRFESQAMIANQDVYAFLKRVSSQTAYDLVFADPPYKKHPNDDDHALRLLESPLSTALASDGLIIFETGDKQPPQHSETWTHADSRHYGRSHLHFFTLTG